MRFPWNKATIETRDDSFTDLAISALVARASGVVQQDRTAPVEVCAGWWGRAFASAKITPDNLGTRSLTPSVLAYIGRALVKEGEALFEINVNANGLTLDAVSEWDIEGGPHRDSWIYRLTLDGPTQSVLRTVSSNRVIHIQYCCESRSPWKGVGPLQGGSISVGLLGHVETRLGQEASGPVGTVISVPNVESSGDLQDDLRKMKGNITLAETVSGEWGAGSRPSGSGGYAPMRLGANPPDSLVNLRNSTASEVLAAAGVPISLIAGGDGAAAREGFRQFLVGTIQPVAKIIVEQLRTALDTPNLEMEFSDLTATDIAARARAFKAMVETGLEIEKAAALSGLMIDDAA